MTFEPILELLARTSVVAGAGLLLSALPGFRAAADRVDVLRATVGILLLLPLLTAIAPGFEVAVLPAGPAETAVAPLPVWQGSVTPVEGVSLSSTLRAPTAMEILIGVWAVGAAVVAGRFVLGVATLWRWTRSGAVVTDTGWTRPLETFAPRGRPRLIASEAVESPLSWGLPPGVVLIGRSCLAKPGTADAVLAHELAHVRRADWLFLALSRLALALFWFNPLVWLLHAVLASRTEDAADAAALAVVDRRTYARALVGLAADFRQSAAIGMAGDAQSLNKRIVRIMNARTNPRPRPLTLALAIGALAAVATPIAAVEITQRAPLPPVPASAPRAPAPPAPPAPPAALAAVAPAVAPAPPAPPAPPRLQDMPAPPAPPALPAPPEPLVHHRLSDAERAELRRHREEARVHVSQARAHVAEARAAAAEARVEAQKARQAARIDQERIRADVAREMAAARVQMRQGADQMVEGAAQMRREAQNLRDPAYRARQIEQARERGDRVPTDAELEALAPRLASQAEELERQAVRLREQAVDRS